MPAPLDLGFPADQVGLIGDVHGQLRPLIEAIWSLAERGVTTAVQLGDWGFIWRGMIDAQGAAVSMIGDALQLADMRLHVVLGNHENYTAIDSLPHNPDGTIPLGPRLTILPRSGVTLAGERRAGWLAGAASVDRSRRVTGREWWPQEVPTDDEAAGLTEGGPVDVVFAHDAIDEPALRARLPQGAWSSRDLTYASEAQALFTQRVASVLTDGGVICSGHYHMRHSAVATLTRPDGTTIHARSEILATGWSRHTVGLLDLRTLTVESWAIDEQRQHRGARSFKAATRGMPLDELAARLGVSEKAAQRLRIGSIPASDPLVRRAQAWALDDA